LEILYHTLLFDDVRKYGFDLERVGLRCLFEKVHGSELLDNLVDDDSGGRYWLR
jgi:hypothetical protein